MGRASRRSSSFCVCAQAGGLARMSLIRTLPLATSFFSCARPIRISFALRKASSRCAAASRACPLVRAGPPAHPMEQIARQGLHGGSGCRRGAKPRNGLADPHPCGHGSPSKPVQASARASSGDGYRAAPAKPCLRARPCALPRRTSPRQERRARGPIGRARSQPRCPSEQEFPRSGFPLRASAYSCSTPLTSRTRANGCRSLLEERQSVPADGAPLTGPCSHSLGGFTRLARPAACEGGRLQL